MATSQMKHIPLVDTLPAPVVTPVVTDVRCSVGQLGAGSWVLYRGHFYVCLYPGQLAGPVGSVAVTVPLDAEVQLVELRTIDLTDVYKNDYARNHGVKREA